MSNVDAQPELLAAARSSAPLGEVDVANDRGARIEMEVQDIRDLAG